MPSSEVESSKIQHQTDEIILLHKKIKCILREDTAFENVLPASQECFTAFSWYT